MNNRRFRIGAINAGITVFFIAALILFNLLAGILSDRYYWKLDMTDGGIYDITDETIQYVGTLDEPVDVIVLATEDMYFSEFSVLGELLKKYEVYGGNMLTLSFVDPNLSTGMLEKYNELGNLSYFDIIVASNRRFKSFSSYDMVQTQYDSQSGQQILTGYQAEQALTSALMYVSNEALPHAVFIDGHGELELASLGRLLENNIFTAGRLNLKTEDIGDDVSLIVIAMPELDYSAEEIQKLDTYFARGGNAWVFFDVGTPKLTVLERYLAEWGFAFRNEIVLDSVSAFGNQLNVIPEFGEHEIIAQMNADNMSALLYGGRPIDVFEVSGRTVTPLITTSKSSYSKDYTDEEIGSTIEKTDKDASGPFVAGVLSEQAKFNNETGVSTVSRVFATTASFTADEMIDTLNAASYSSSLLNVRFMNSIAKYFNTSADNVTISPKQIPDSVMNIPVGTGLIIMILLAAVLPLLIFGAGVAVWMRRRRL